MMKSKLIVLFVGVFTLTILGISCDRNNVEEKDFVSDEKKVEEETKISDNELNNRIKEMTEALDRAKKKLAEIQAKAAEMTNLNNTEEETLKDEIAELEKELEETRQEGPYGQFLDSNFFCNPKAYFTDKPGFVVALSWNFPDQPDTLEFFVRPFSETDSEEIILAPSTFTFTESERAFVPSECFGGERIRDLTSAIPRSGTICVALANFIGDRYIPVVGVNIRAKKDEKVVYENECSIPTHRVEDHCRLRVVIEPIENENKYKLGWSWEEMEPIVRGACENYNIFKIKMGEGEDSPVHSMPFSDQSFTFDVPTGPLDVTYWVENEQGQRVGVETERVEGFVGRALQEEAEISDVKIERAIDEASWQTAGNVIRVKFKVRNTKGGYLIAPAPFFAQLSDMTTPSRVLPSTKVSYVNSRMGYLFDPNGDRRANLALNLFYLNEKFGRDQTGEKRARYRFDFLETGDQLVEYTLYTKADTLAPYFAIVAFDKNGKSPKFIFHDCKRNNACRLPDVDVSEVEGQNWSSIFHLNQPSALLRGNIKNALSLKYSMDACVQEVSGSTVVWEDGRAKLWQNGEMSDVRGPGPDQLDIHPISNGQKSPSFPVDLACSYRETGNPAFKLMATNLVGERVFIERKHDELPQLRIVKMGGSSNSITIQYSFDQTQTGKPFPYKLLEISPTRPGPSCGELKLIDLTRQVEKKGHITFPHSHDCSQFIVSGKLESRENIPAKIYNFPVTSSFLEPKAVQDSGICLFDSDRVLYRIKENFEIEGEYIERLEASCNKGNISGLSLSDSEHHSFEDKLVRYQWDKPQRGDAGAILTRIIPQYECTIIAVGYDGSRREFGIKRQCQPLGSGDSNNFSAATRLNAVEGSCCQIP